MRWGAAVIAAIAGCYSPTVPSGVPCDPMHPSCPAGQSCLSIGGMPECTSATADAPPSSDSTTAADGALADDDGDGIPNVRDNCPTIANPGQENEDGDRFGDACDPCPPIADDNPPDADDDGVADACDPRPNTPGDRITLFEGFDHGIPAGWARNGGTWTAGADFVRVTVTDGQNATLTPNFVATTSGTATIGTVAESLNGTASRSVGIVDPSGGAAGLSCELFVPQFLVGTDLVIGDLASSSIVASTALDWAVDQTWVLAMSRATTDYTCTGTLAGFATSTYVSSATDADPPAIALRVHSVNARFLWVMYVDSPP